MSAPAKSKWQTEYDALPGWAKKMVKALMSCVSYGGGSDDYLSGMTQEHRKQHFVFHVTMHNDAWEDWWSGFGDAKELAHALTAPWPPPPPPPARERRAFNLVELVDDGEDSAFDQPCAFGHRVDGHAVYCHNEGWPNGPRKCRRRQDDPKYLHEDCPGFVLNPDASA